MACKALLVLVTLHACLHFHRADKIETRVVVQKCCERYEVMVAKHKCLHANETPETPWQPTFADEQGRNTIEVKDYKLDIGVPGCGTRQQWQIYHQIMDRLVLLADGTLRHFAARDGHLEEFEEDLTENNHFYDYKPGRYCIDKKLETDPNRTFVSSQFAIVCAPDMSKGWQNPDFILRKILDPIFHVTSIICYVTVAIIHFVLPQLRDLVGNIITTMSICLVVSQAADLVRIFTEVESLSFLIADVIMAMSLLGAFFWLNSLGFYIWKTFRSRNVFLRITDGRKYCYYSYFVWSSTLSVTLLAVFAHLTLDTPSSFNRPSVPATQGTAIGSLGILVFFSPITFTVFANIYFYVATFQILGRMSTYGRIHHKLKFCFETFLKLFIVMTVGWIFVLLSWLPFAGIYYSYITINALEAPLILYISVLSQRRVRFLLRKACCYDKCFCKGLRPDHANDGPEWGEEMMAMNR